MSAPYFNSEETASGFFEALGRIIVAWSAIERSVDIILFAAQSFHADTGKAIVSWKRKTEALRKALKDSAPKHVSRKWLDGVVDELIVCGGQRNTLIHGYCCGTTDEEKPKIIFRASRYHAESVDSQQISASKDDLLELLAVIQGLDRDLSGLTIWFWTMPRPDKA